MLDAQINRPVSWNGKPLTGDWQVTLKIDGVRAIWHDIHGWRRRAEKPLYNIPSWNGGPRDCKLYVGSFSDTIRATLTKHTKPDTPPILHNHFFGLHPLDPRLHVGWLSDPTADIIHAQLIAAQSSGYGGLVLRQGERWIKVKPRETHDVPITGFSEGRGKHAGRLGFIATPLGNVASGFSDDERAALWTEALAGTLVGQTVEIDCMMLSAAGKFRHPTFLRLRPDKGAHLHPTAP